MNNGRIGREYRRLHRRAALVGETAMKRYLNDVSEVELNFMRSRRVGEPIERLLRFSFELLNNTNNLVNGSFIDHTERPIDKQTSVFVKLDVRRKVDVVHSDCFFLLTRGVRKVFGASCSGGTPSHCAASLRS